VMVTSTLVDLERSETTFDKALPSRLDEPLAIPMVVWSELLVAPFDSAPSFPYFSVTDGTSDEAPYLSYHVKWKRQEAIVKGFFRRQYHSSIEQ